MFTGKMQFGSLEMAMGSGEIGETIGWEMVFFTPFSRLGPSFRFI